ncbi:MAG: DNA polymerase IV, partial [Coriobacteriales bacterium]|nr:DNA polymerase IV [Coriobacteriales bacterium]
KKGLSGYQVTLKLKFDFSHTHTAQCQLRDSTDDEHVFGPVARSLLDGLWSEGTPVRLVGVGMSGFDRRPVQLGLFDEQEEAPGHKRDTRALNEVFDQLRSRFGNDAISYGRDLRL